MWWRWLCHHATFLGLSVHTVQHYYKTSLNFTVTSLSLQIWNIYVVQTQMQDHSDHSDHLFWNLFRLIATEVNNIEKQCGFTPYAML